MWFSSGIGLTRWIRPVLGYAIPVTLVIALLSLVLSPWALTKADEFKRRLDSRDDVSAATPGAFRESKQADRVFFLEDVDTREENVSAISSCSRCRTAKKARWSPRKDFRRPRRTAIVFW